MRSWMKEEKQSQSEGRWTQTSKFPRLCSGEETVEKAGTAKCVQKYNSSIFIKLQCFILLKVGGFGEASVFDSKVPEGLKTSPRRNLSSSSTNALRFVVLFFLSTQTYIFSQKNVACLHR